MHEKSRKTITIEWLIDAKRMAETDPVKAKIIYGLNDKIIQMLIAVRISRLTEIAATGFIYFMPRSNKMMELALTGGDDWAKYAAQMIAQP